MLHIIISVMVKSTKQKQNNVWISMLAFFGFTMASIVFSILCINNGHVMIIQKNTTFFTVLAVAVLFSLCGLSLWAVVTRKNTLTKALLSVYLLLLFSLIFIYILQKTEFFRLVDSPKKLQEYLRKTGIWMPIFYILLQFLQVVILPIPSVVSTIAGVALFGAFWATIYSLAGILLGSITAFFIGRKWGNKAVSWMVGEETLIKWQKKLKGKDNLFLTIMFVLPLFPDDILCFVAGLSTMTTKYFLVAVLLARFIGIFATCYSIDFIPFTTWWGLGLWILFALCIIVAFIYIYRNMDKLQQKRKKRARNK